MKLERAAGRGRRVMAEEWFYVENGASHGPVSREELSRRIDAAKGEPQLVWSPGMPEWADARTLAPFAPRPSPAPIRRPVSNPAVAASGSTSTARSGTALLATGAAPGREAQAVDKPKSLAQRARHELVAFAAIASYLMVWFLAVMFYKATILRSVGIDIAPIGFAVVKSLILAKFMLMLEAVKLGDRRGAGDIMALQILKKALLFTLALIVMSMIEEVVVGHFHGRDAREVLREMSGGSLSQVMASAILMFLVLLPYMAFRRLALAIGDLPALLFTKGGASKSE